MSESPSSRRDRDNGSDEHEEQSNKKPKTCASSKPESSLATVDETPVPKLECFSTDARWLDDKQGPVYRRVASFYAANHGGQTVAHGQEMRAKYHTLDRQRLGIMEVVELLDDVVDESDPDLGLSQIYHCYQTAEALRNRFPDEEKYGWLHLTALIHDCGKLLVKFGVPQWSVVGDTFPVGCAHQQSSKLLYPHFFETNPDCKDPVYSTRLGCYQEGCGFDHVTMSYGHDEYLYHVLSHPSNQHAETPLPIEALYIIRYHSFWAWHFGGEYDYLASDRDRKMLPLLSHFRASDLYSKDNKFVLDIEALKPYYARLAKRFLPDTINW